MSGRVIKIKSVLGGWKCEICWAGGGKTGDEVPLIHEKTLLTSENGGKMR